MMTFLKLLLTHFWPMLIPVAFYAVWALILSRRVGEDGQRIAWHLKRAALFWTVFSSIALMIGCFIWWALEQPSNREGVYVPPTQSGGKLIPGHVVLPDSQGRE